MDRQIRSIIIYIWRRQQRSSTTTTAAVSGTTAAAAAVPAHSTADVFDLNEENDNNEDRPLRRRSRERASVQHSSTDAART